MKLGLTLQGDETWREATARRGRECGVEQEVIKAFDDATLDGNFPKDAAYIALREWDSLEILK